MSETVQSSAVESAAKLLKPLVRILLRNGIPFRTFTDVVKRVYVEVTSEGADIRGRKQSISRISILTGLTRKEISRLLAPAPGTDRKASDRYNRAARVIGGWVRDRRFHNNRKQPANLPLEGRGATFAELVKRYGGDVPARAVLDELMHVGAVKKVGSSSIRLVQRAYLPKTDQAGMLEILGTDASDLISTINHNMTGKNTSGFFQRKVAYDNLPTETVQEVRKRSAAKGQAWLEQMDQWLARHDRDRNPSVRGSGRMRAGIGIYYFEESMAGNPEEDTVRSAIRSTHHGGDRKYYEGRERRANKELVSNRKGGTQP